LKRLFKVLLNGAKKMLEFAPKKSFFAA